MSFNMKFVMEMFLDDSVATMNRLIVATANVANENIENLAFIQETLQKEHNKIGSHITSPDMTKTKKKKEKGNYFEHTVKYFTDSEFLNDFKINVYTVQALIDFLKDFIQPDTSVIPFDKKVHVFLYLLTSDLSFYEVGDKFGLHKSTVAYIFHEIASLLCEQRYHFINWPSLEEQQVTSMKVNSRFRFPNCVGFIDACRLKVGSKRKKNKKTDTILLQAVCDETFMFTDVYVGDIGNTKKSRVFRESPLAKEIKNFINVENHLLGDTEFKLRKNLITPFSNNELLTADEVKFNEIHWNARIYIGQAFQILKGRFQKLNHIDVCKPESVKTLIYAACCLHNFILLHEGSSQFKEETNLNNDSISFDTDIVITAVEKRQFLCNYINFIENT